MKQYFFYNKTDVPILIDYWIRENWVENVCCIKSIKIEPGQKGFINSSFGEWVIHSDFSDPIETKRWIEKGYQIFNPIGKCNVEKQIFKIFYNLFSLHYLETKDGEGNQIGNVLFCFKKIKLD